jgi:hypothetical protein
MHCGYRGGKYQLDTKMLEVQKTSRFQLNQQLEQLLPSE